MKDKVVLITGGNKGIGFEIASQLGKNGYHIIISGRNHAKLSEALKILESRIDSAEMILMDVDYGESIKNAATLISSKKIKIDILINNAAILYEDDDSILSSDFNILEKTINTNGYGVLRVIRAFLPLMNKPGKIINISSGGGSMTEPVGGWSPAYCTSKTFLNALTRHLSYELSNHSISVNAVCPGWVRTDMGGRSAPRSVERGAETPVWLASEAPFSLTGKFFRDKKEINW